MERLRAWVYGHKSAADNSGIREEGSIATSSAEIPTTLRDNSLSSSQAVDPNPNVEIDPQVAEYFKQFPEPYREKVVQRYSNREGIYRWDFLRNWAMKNEMHNALKGVFLEDQREFEKLQREGDIFERERQKAEERQKFYEREISPWEQIVLEFVPLQPGDSMKIKLFQTTCLVSFGILSVMSAFTYKIRHPTPIWRVYSTMIGSIGTCGCCQVIAAYRLMDWGPFDNTVDDRDLISKAHDDFTETFRVLKSFLES